MYVSKNIKNKSFIELIKYISAQDLSTVFGGSGDLIQMCRKDDALSIASMGRLSLENFSSTYAYLGSRMIFNIKVYSKSKYCR